MKRSKRPCAPWRAAAAYRSQPRLTASSGSLAGLRAGEACPPGEAGSSERTQGCARLGHAAGMASTSSPGRAAEVVRHPARRSRAPARDERCDLWHRSRRFGLFKQVKQTGPHERRAAARHRIVPEVPSQRHRAVRSRPSRTDVFVVRRNCHPDRMGASARAAPAANCLGA